MERRDLGDNHAAAACVSGFQVQGKKFVDPFKMAR